MITLWNIFGFWVYDDGYVFTTTLLAVLILNLGVREKTFIKLGKNYYKHIGNGN